MANSSLRIARTLALMLVITSVSVQTNHLWAQEKNFLWKASGDKNTVYILGSIHLLKRESAALKPIVQEVFSKSKRLVLEIDLVREGPAKFQQLLMQKGIDPEGKQLEQQLSQETYALTAKRASDLGVDLKILAPFKPWVVALTMVVMQLQKLGYDPNLGIDHQLARRAKQADKPVDGLETAEFQIDIFSRLTASEQDMFLRQSLLEMDQLEKSVDDLVAVWNSGDVARGEQLFLESMRAYPELKAKLIDERNRSWIGQIEQFLKQDDNILVVVGSAHLVGKGGVIEILKARGYDLEQM
ncbi:MAG TPA: TraB/GumN family protein [Candidatus Binatia bacterium]|nr:TraB/GumN family protein [Candidatus Binatia bacterium]